MKIVVCQKQVPDIALIGVSDGQLTQPAGAGMVNPYDMYAIEEGLRLKERTEGELTALSLGHDGTETGLREALALGADAAIHLKDEAFAGSDAVATGRLLAAAIEKIGDVKVVLFGKQAVDTDASAVVGAVAGSLGWPQVLFVRKIDSIDDGHAEVVRMTEDGSDRCRVTLPAVISVVKEINEPRLPSLKGKLASKKKPVTAWGLSALGLDGGGVGSSSPTRVKASSLPPPRGESERLEGEPAEVAARLFEKLREEKIL